MNFLGHLYFSNNDIELMYANLFGDFVKGKDLSAYDEQIQKGIQLHRHIDSYIDTHPVVLELLHDLYRPLPKIAGIAVDLYFDHLLAKNWQDYSSRDYTDFLDDFHNYAINLSPYKSQEFEIFISKLKSGKWIYHYPTEYGLTKASQGLSRRISFPNQLAEAPTIFRDNEQKIEHVFRSFMQEAIPHFEDYFRIHS